MNKLLNNYVEWINREEYLYSLNTHIFHLQSKAGEGLDETEKVSEADIIRSRERCRVLDDVIYDISVTTGVNVVTEYNKWVVDMTPINVKQYRIEVI